MGKRRNTPQPTTTPHSADAAAWASVALDLASAGAGGSVEVPAWATSARIVPLAAGFGAPAAVVAVRAGAAEIGRVGGLYPYHVVRIAPGTGALTLDVEAAGGEGADRGAAVLVEFIGSGRAETERAWQG